MQINSELMTDISASQETNQEILAMLGMQEHTGAVQYHVYHTMVDDKEVYCCLSGGIVENNEITFTPIGLGAFEALTRINPEQADYFAEELKISNGSIKAQVEEVLMKVPAKAKVCFIGDMTGELKESIAELFPLALN